jgi:hypothetical protein
MARRLSSTADDEMERLSSGAVETWLEPDEIAAIVELGTAGRWHTIAELWPDELHVSALFRARSTSNPSFALMRLSSKRHRAAVEDWAERVGVEPHVALRRFGLTGEPDPRLISQTRPRAARTAP